MIKFKTVKPSVVGGRRKRTVNVNKNGAFFSQQELWKMRD